MRRVLLLAALALPPAGAAAQDRALSLEVSVAGLTRSGPGRHVSFQVRNRLPADILRFTAGFRVLDGSGASVGEGVFATGRVRRLQPYQRVASFAPPADRSEGCAEAALVELDVRECALDGTGDVGAVYCRETFVPGEGALAVRLAGGAPAGEAEESEIAALGLRVAPLTSGLARLHGISGASRGLVVTAVEEPGGGPGLREGDLIVEVDQDPVDAAAALEERIRAARAAGQASVLCMVVRGGERRWLAARLRDG